MLTGFRFLRLVPQDGAIFPRSQESGELLLLRKRLVFDACNQPIEFHLNWYRPDDQVLRLELEATSGK